MWPEIGTGDMFCPVILNEKLFVSYHFVFETCSKKTLLCPWRNGICVPCSTSLRPHTLSIQVEKVGLWELFTVLDPFVLCPDVVFRKKAKWNLFILVSYHNLFVPCSFNLLQTSQVVCFSFSGSLISVYSFSYFSFRFLRSKYCTVSSIRDQLQSV